MNVLTREDYFARVTQFSRSILQEKIVSDYFKSCFSKSRKTRYLYNSEPDYSRKDLIGSFSIQTISGTFDLQHDYHNTLHVF